MKAIHVRAVVMPDGSLWVEAPIENADFYLAFPCPDWPTMIYQLQYRPVPPGYAITLHVTDLDSECLPDAPPTRH